MLLWVLFAVLTVLAMVFVLWPLIRIRNSEIGIGPNDSLVYRDQLEEIDADLARGLIGEAEAEAARTEISRRLLEAADKGETRTGAGFATGRNATLATLVVAIGIPLMALGLYGAYGSPDKPDQPLAPRLAEAHSNQDLSTLLGKVEARLREHPEDGHGWDVVAPVYQRLRRYSDAADAYARALRLLGESPARLVGYAESLVLSNNGIVEEKARIAFEKAYAGDKSLAKPQFWMGMAAEQDGKLEKASDIWRRMLTNAPAAAPWRPMVLEQLANVDTRIGRTPFGSTASGEGSAPESASSDASAPPGPTREDVAAAQEMTAEERGAMIQQMVTGLAERLQEDGSDLQGWFRLVRAYTVLGERAKAEEALKSARENFQNDEKALAELSDLAGSLGL